MTDRELLELAAKAAGYEVIKEFPYQIAVSCGALNPLEGVKLFGLVIHDGVEVRSPWNPLFDDGDALRLAVALGININIDLTYYDTNGELSPCTEAAVVRDDVEAWPSEFHSNDAMKATRRAIVRAAAEIGRGIGRDVEPQSEVKPEEVKRIIDPALRQCHAKDCWECGGTGYSASSGMICRTNDEPPF